MFWNKKELTSDQELANNLRAACKAYNEALKACGVAGLSTGVYEVGSTDSRILWGKKLEVRWAARNNRQEL